MKKIICQECGEEKFNHGHGFCHKCYMKIQMRERRKKYPERFHELDKARWKGKRQKENNKQRIERYYKNHEENIKRNREYAIKNKEKIRKQQKEYYQRNIERIRAKNREYNKRRDQVKEFTRLRNWVAAQPKEKIRAIQVRQSQRRMARAKELPHTLTVEEWEDIKKIFSFKCAYCGQEKPLTQDHIIPLSRGGGYTRDNIVPACRSCNSKKGRKTAEEYLNKLHGS